MIRRTRRKSIFHPSAEFLLLTGLLLPPHSFAHPIDSTYIEKTMGTHYAKAFQFQRESKFKEARDELSKAIAIKPNDPRLYLERSFTELQLKLYRDVIADVNRAIVLSEKSNLGDLVLSNGYANRSKAYAALGQFDRAIEDMKRRAKADSTDTGAHVDLAELYSKKGDRTMAIQETELARNGLNKYDPSYEELDKRIKSLEARKGLKAPVSKGGSLKGNSKNIADNKHQK